MDKNYEERSSLEKIYIIQPIITSDFKSLHEEAVSLIKSCGAIYAGTIYQTIREINPATYIGEGKLLELKERLEGLDVTVLFNGELSPTQTLNISTAIGNLKVIDRTTLILDIFAKNAKSNEGKLQVELAQLKYIYPRLKGKGAALSRLGGGIGTRGPGESKLETDRRKIRLKINLLQRRIQELSDRRKNTAARRKKNNVNSIALVGYTNVGKSSLMNFLTNSMVYSDDLLFATLDTTTRKCIINDTEFILTDTVGFIRQLPHDLISAFESTLESALNCDLLLIVCDASDNYSTQFNTTLSVLQNLKINTPYLQVINKCDLIKDRSNFPPNCIFVSAQNGSGIEKLKAEIVDFFAKNRTICDLRIPYSELNAYFKNQNLIRELTFNYQDSYLEVKADIPNIHLQKFTKYRFIKN